MVFHWSLSDSKSQVSRTLLSILAVLNNAIVWMVSTLPPTSKSSSPFSYCSKRTIHNWYNCHQHVPQFFQYPSKVEVLILLFTFFHFYSVVSRDSKIDYFASFLFFVERLRADKEKKQKIPRKNNCRCRLRRWHSDTGKYTQPSRNTTA